MYVSGRRSKVLNGIVLVALLSLIVTAVNVTLNYPSDTLLLTNSTNVTVNCSAITDFGLNNISLYHNVNGSFSLNQTRNFGLELQHKYEQGLVLLMHFNNDSNFGENQTVVYDHSGSGNNGTIKNVTFNSTGGQFNGAFEFNGGFNSANKKNESIEIADSNSLDLTTKGTIAMWAYFYADATGFDQILTKGDDFDSDSSYAIWLNNLGGKVTAVLYVGNGASNEEVRTNGDLVPNQWHHLVVSWDNTQIRWYVNGKLNNSGAQSVTPFAGTNVLRIGKNSIQQESFDGTIDELAIYNRNLTDDEISVLAGIKPASYNQSFVVENVPDNENYIWNCLVNDNATKSNFSSSNFTFNVDNNPPLFESIQNFPISQINLDPGVVVNVTANISDRNNISVVILQYKQQSASKFTNVTMSNNTLGYTNTSFNASFTANVNGNWTYQIFTNTSNDVRNTSEETNLVVEFDYTWDATPSLGSTTGNLEENKHIGNITINNTGDFTLNFDLSDNSPGGLSYNVTEPFDLDPGAKIGISVNATFASTEREDEISIAVDATTAQADPSVANTSATLVTTAGGAYLSNTIINSVTSINHSDSINLYGSVKNIGNESATNTSLAWKLPSTDWTNYSGNLSNNFGDLSVGSTEFNNVTINISTDISVGTYTIYLNSTCDNNVTSGGCNDVKSFTISVSCSSTDGVCGTGCTHLTDNDCPVPTDTVTVVDSGGGGGGGGAGGGSGAALNEFVESEAVFELVRGKDDSFELPIHNPYNGPLTNITVDVTGFLAQYIELTNIPKKIIGNGTVNFTIKIKAPRYFTKGNWRLDFEINGIAQQITLSNSTRTIKFREKRAVTLAIHELSRENATSLLNFSYEQIARLDGLNIGTKKLNKLLNEAKKKFEERDYEGVAQINFQIKERVDKAIEVLKTIEEFEKKTTEARNKGIETPDTFRLLSLAKYALEREDFLTAADRLKEIELTFSLETKGEFSVLFFVRNNPILVSTVGMSNLILAILLFFLVKVQKVNSELKKLNGEKVIIGGLVKTAQRECFEAKRISVDQYNTITKQYQGRLTKVLQRIIELESVKASLIKPLVRGLEIERNRLLDLIKQTQDEYIVKGGQEASLYKSKIHNYSTRLTELEGKIIMKETKEVLRKERRTKFLNLVGLKIKGKYRLHKHKKNKLKGHKIHGHIWWKKLTEHKKHGIVAKTEIIRKVLTETFVNFKVKVKEKLKFNKAVKFEKMESPKKTRKGKQKNERRKKEKVEGKEKKVVEIKTKEEGENIELRKIKKLRNNKNNNQNKDNKDKDNVTTRKNRKNRQNKKIMGSKKTMKLIKKEK